MCYLLLFLKVTPRLISFRHKKPEKPQAIENKRLFIIGTPHAIYLSIIKTIKNNKKSNTITTINNNKNSNTTTINNNKKSVLY